MSGDLVLSRAQQDRLLKLGGRRRVVTSEVEVSLAKIIYEQRAEEFEAVNHARQAFEMAHPWILDENEEIPEDLRQTGEGIEPAYRNIQSRYKALCERGDKISDQLFSAPQSLQAAISKQADYEIKSGGMVSAAAAMALVLQVTAAAGLRIDGQHDKDSFIADVTAYRREFIEANPHLRLSSAGG